MHYHYHERRDEVWTVVEGSGRVVIDGEERKVTVGDVVIMKAGQKHTVVAESLLKLIEVQIGKDISAEDKVKV